MILAFLSAEPAVNNYNATHKAMGDLLPTALNGKYMIEARVLTSFYYSTRH